MFLRKVESTKLKRLMPEKTESYISQVRSHSPISCCRTASETKTALKIAILIIKTITCSPA